MNNDVKSAPGRKARFHLPGLRYNYPLNMIFVDLMKNFPQYFMEDVEIASFFGDFPTSRWGGGRFCGDDQCDAGFIRNVIRTINAQNIPVRFTFTSPLITEEDLADPYCNFCMQVGDNGMNEVMVVSPILEQYIRERYPSYKINSSTCKEIRNLEALQEELSKDYNFVVLDFNLNPCLELLAQIKDKSHCELLVNACCQPNCPRRGEHYRFVAEENLALLHNRSCPPEERISVKKWTCKYGENNSVYSIQDYVTVISPEKIREIYMPMGFENFKLEGRTANLYNLIETYCYYMVKPEYQGDARILLLTNLEKNHVITANQPRKGIWMPGQ